MGINEEEKIDEEFYTFMEDYLEEDGETKEGSLGSELDAILLKYAER